jgi:hypothetical protein
MRAPFSFHGVEAERTLGAIPVMRLHPANTTSQQSLPGRVQSALNAAWSALYAVSQLNPLCVVSPTVSDFQAKYNAFTKLTGLAWPGLLVVDGKYGPQTEFAARTFVHYVLTSTGAVGTTLHVPGPCSSYNGSNPPIPGPGQPVSPAPRLPGSMANLYFHGPKTLGDAASSATDAQMQMVGLATFFTGVNAGQSPNPTQLAAAMTAVQNIQNDLVAMGAVAPTPNAVGGVTKLQAVGIGVGSAVLGALIDRATK